MNQNDGSSISSPSSPIPNKNPYRKRKKTLKKKAEELSILCQIPVALISVEPTGKVDIWPEDRQLVGEILRKYLEKTTNAPETVSVSVKDRNSNSDGERRSRKRRKLMYDTWPSELDYWPEEALVRILEEVERKEKLLDQRVFGEEDHEMVSNP